MKIWTSEHTFTHPWETVTQAVWRKYPNPHNPAVVGTDVIERRVTGGVLHTHRLISSRWGLPNWAQKILGSDRVCYGYEHSEVDPEERTMTMRTRNLTFASTVSMDERLVYSPDPNNSGNTVLRQETIITVKGVPLTSYMENYLINSISNNSFKRGGCAFTESLAPICKLWGDDICVQRRQAAGRCKATEMRRLQYPSYYQPLLVAPKEGNEIEEPEALSLQEKGRDALEFVISKINHEVEELVSTYKRSTSEILDHTKRSLGEITESAMRSVDDISSAAKKSVDGLSDAAKKSIDDISCVAKKGIDTFTQPTSPGPMPRI
ncbi:Protein slowmo [Chionoecetes opilio]|uniref:Protein slowmo n=1 Tax=Chionoecetes opilio TaxID=41210 RepID=A0A8J4YTC4_CHIOP|nr:Protein slowmo [Chionoecetes opilio]